MVTPVMAEVRLDKRAAFISAAPDYYEIDRRQIFDVHTVLFRPGYIEDEILLLR